MNRDIGMHIRYNQSIIELIEKTTSLSLPIFQCFLRQQSGKIVQIQEHDIALFETACHVARKSFVHASYRINLAEPTFTHHPALKQELYWTRKLGFKHIILHSGASTIHDHGIDAIVRTLNSLTKSTKDIQFVLENVAFTKPSIGGSLEDLHAIRNKLLHPERVGFCIDTAHAYAYGYDLATAESRKQFIDLLGSVLGYNNIALIHINDTQSRLGTHHDIHCTLGTGTIGHEALRSFALDPHLIKIPLILELPILTDTEEKIYLTAVRNWHKNR